MAAWLLTLALGCALRSSAAEPAPLILISLDGFRWDYCDLHPAETPTLRALKRDGVSSRGLVPVFPTNTFPNHYTIVTGLYPSNHGIVNNDFLDAESGRIFRYNQPGSARDSTWWGGEPIWVTAIRQGKKAASSFWVGSEAEIHGVRPTFYRNYDYSVPFEVRLKEMIGWLTLPPKERPALVTFYFEEANGAGHRYGPDSAELVAAVKYLDERVREMLAALRARSIEPNIVIVADHGMTSTSAKRTVILEDYVERSAVHVDADGSALALRPVDGDIDRLMRAVSKMPHAKAYRSEDLPPHFQLKPGPRVAPVWVLPEEGWHVVPRATFERHRERYSESGYLQGDHGYDPALASMRGIFVAHGPAFRRGVTLPEVENIHIYNLLCAVLGLTPAKNDGDDRLVRAALVQRP